MKGRPISPSEVVSHRAATLIPPEVYDIINTMILRHWDGSLAHLDEVTLVDALVSTGITREEVYQRNYLDFETIYSEAGWIVTWNHRRSSWTFAKREERHR